MNETVIVTQSVHPAVHADRWGNFHPCKYRTYRKLKALSKIVTRFRSLVAAARRWHRKLPKNRGNRSWVLGPLLPEGCVDRGPFWSRTGPWVPTPDPLPYQESPFLRWRDSQEPELSDLAGKVLRDYLFSRLAFKSPEKVKPLLLTEKEIDTLYARLVAQ